MRIDRRSGRSKVVAVIAIIGGFAAVSPAAEADVSFVRSFSVGGSQFALDGAGSVFVARAGAIDRYDTLGNPQTGFTVSGVGFGSPNDLTYSGGKLYAVDAGSNKLIRWDPNGANQLVSPVATETFVNLARSVAVSGNTAYVSGGETRRVARLSLFPTFGEFSLLFGWGVATGTDGGFQTCGSPGPCFDGFGAGPELGRINDARGLALDGAGNLYVAESATGYSRIQVFNASPAPVGAIGSQGTGSGQLSEPGGIALDGSGNVFVADQHNQRVDQFRTDGAFVQAFGFGVRTGAVQLETCTTGCLPGIAGSAPGQLNFPYEVAADGAGNVYVSSLLGGRISVYGVPGSGSSPPPDLTPDKTPPATTIGKGPKKKTKKRKAKFTFSSDDPAASFQCKLDKKPLAACSSPKKVKVKPGRHKFSVKAIDAAGNIDASAAKFAWKVLRG